MKPNKIQLDIIKAIKNQLSYWENSNDINSPTVNSDITEGLFAEIPEELDGMQLIEFEDIVLNLLKTIRKYGTK